MGVYISVCMYGYVHIGVYMCTYGAYVFVSVYVSVC